MEVKIATKEITGKIKPMNCVNNGPLKPRLEQVRDNFEAYRNARIPYARNHDAAFLQEYGGEHIVDVDNIFTDFDADPLLPASYDFTLTDEYLKTTLDAGTKIFYRLGSKIEHWSKKYHTLPPRNFKKWAVICEHIIRHYNEGWADGFDFGIEYWEIWNEPDWAEDDAKDKQTWGGTKAEFFDFYEIAAKHLKNRFPKLKIGGPAVCIKPGWSEDFLAEMNKRNVPIDFFSWHIYTGKPGDMVILAERFRKLLDKNGYKEAESILNEWNLIEKGWAEGYVHSLLQIPAMRGASFTAAAMAACQYAPVDMLMYYDARPGTCFNGMFDHITFQPIKGYWPFVMFSKLFDLGNAVKTETDDGEVYAVAAADGNKFAAMITLFAEINDEERRGGTPAKTIKLTVDRETANLRTFILDNDHTFVETDGLPEKIRNNAVLFVTGELK